MYNSRVWLNKAGKPSTGSIVAYEGESDWSENTVQFFEIADCHGKVRLHKTDNDTITDYCQKLRILVNEAEKFATHLENNFDIHNCNTVIHKNDIRIETAKEIIQYIKEQGTIKAYPAGADVYYIMDDDLEVLRVKFGVKE
jgi:hypothetical protein